jgi:hypothetical protein
MIRAKVPTAAGQRGTVIEILSYPFMQRTDRSIADRLIAPAIGTYVVQRRLSLLGDGLGHVASPVSAGTTDRHSTNSSCRGRLRRAPSC